MTPSPKKKSKFLDRLAEENGVAIVVVDEASHEVSVSNNNSMCRSLWASAEFAPSCAEYCGKAFAAASKAGKTIEYECYAGLACKAVPVIDGGKQFVAITGRTFLKAENYRKATEKAITGEWRQFRPTEFFENILMTGSDANLVKTAERLEKFSRKRGEDILEIDKPAVKMPEILDERSHLEPAAEITNLIKKFNEGTDQPASPPGISAGAQPQDDSKEISAWRSLFGSLMK
ncbi:MAG: PocR ligand-binding domain-containing protein, partial [Saprospiraceae bacterium]|nr:PocR ligand-binding domain-containing protein [Pyrinomonadaceae bacterium]